MARRLRIPLLVDAAIVSDEPEMARLNNEPSICRGLSGTGPWLHRLLWNRIQDTFSVGDGRLLPTFEPRDRAARAETQEREEARLTAMAAMPHPFDRDAVASLGEYVAGGHPAVPIGVTTQQIVGRLFDRAYTATRESYDAARVVNAVLSACPVDVLRVAWWKFSGRLAWSRALLWRLANNDPIAIHSTVIAIHNVVDSLKRMRAAMRADGPWQATPAEAAAASLASPSMLLRQCALKTELHGPRPGALVLFRLQRMHEGTESNDLALARREWSQCPAHAIVPRLLEEVWQAAVSAASLQRYRPRRSLAYWLFAVPAIHGFTRLNRLRPWYRLPRWLGFVNLAALRSVLRERNLYDTSLLPCKTSAPLPAGNPDVVRWRTADGSFNDLQDPDMGRAGTRFGRNVPLGYTYPDERLLLEPNPRRVSRLLLTRRKFTSAPSLNVLAAAWTQFQVHDWFSHGESDPTDPITIPVDPDDGWPGDRPMRIGRTPPDPTRADHPPVGPPTYLNRVTHWWDASQLYGSDMVSQRRVRAGRDGKLVVDGQRRLPVDDRGIEITGLNDNWWLGLSIFHHLFTHEHNVICDRLRTEYPGWDDERLFQTARLINAALIAKIHEIEWVPTILAHPTAQKGLHVSWWGLLGKRIATTIGRFHASDMLGGVPGSATSHHAAPYAITEEFVSVYRMHAFMMPDDFEIYSAEDRQRMVTLPLARILGAGARDTAEKFGMTNVVYSFGRAMPGALRLGNYATALQQFRMPGTGALVDLGTVDIVRDRERGVPRYNQFRQLLHLPPVRSFEELNPEWADQLRTVYGTVDRIDLMVGMFAETPPPGFGFSETTFRVFLLMNSRRLKSDRFFTTDYRPAVYTQIGLDWIDENDLRSVLLRHHPELEPVLVRVSKVFAPWPD